MRSCAHPARQRTWAPSTDKVTLQIAGRGTMSQGDREIDLLPGTIAVWDTGRAYSLRLDEDFRFLVAMFPKAAVDMPPGLEASSPRWQCQARPVSAVS